MWPVLYLVAGLILVFTFDWCYLFNSYWTILWGLIRAQKPLTDTFSTHVIASFINTDTAFDHLNNAKYIMYLDFARIDFWCRSRLFYLLWRNRNVPLQSATIIRYMKPIQIFASARIDTKVIVSLIDNLTPINFPNFPVGLVGRDNVVLGAQVYC